MAKGMSSMEIAAPLVAVLLQGFENEVPLPCTRFAKRQQSEYQCQLKSKG